MKKVSFLVCLAMLFAQIGFAEPFVLEQGGNVLERKTLEVGLTDIGYQYDLVRLTNAGGDVITELTRTVTLMPLFARYAFSSKFEAMLSVPYASISSKNAPVSGDSITTEDSGLADPVFKAKYLIGDKKWKTSLAAGITYPMGKESTKISGAFKNGMNIEPAILMTKACKSHTLNINLAYNMKAEYTDEDKIKQKPGDVMTFGVGMEKPCKKNKNIALIGEFIYRSLSEAKEAEKVTSGSAGTVMDAVIGVRYNKGNVKTKLGVDISLGEEKYRRFDYQLIAGITYLIK